MVNGFYIFNDKNEVLSDKCFYDLLLEIKRKKLVPCDIVEHSEDGSFVLMLNHNCGKEFRLKMTNECDFLATVDELYDDLAKVYAKHKRNYSPNWLHPRKPIVKDVHLYDRITAIENTGNVLSSYRFVEWFSSLRRGHTVIQETSNTENGTIEWHLRGSKHLFTLTLIAPNDVDLYDSNIVLELMNYYDKKHRKEQRKLANDAKNEPIIELDVNESNITASNIAHIYSINQYKRTWIDTKRHSDFATDVKTNKAKITKLTAQGKLRTATVEYKYYVFAMCQRKKDPDYKKVYGNVLRHKIYEIRYIVDSLD